MRPNEIAEELVEQIHQSALAMSRSMRIDYRAAVRRLIGTSASASSAERVAAAQAKRDRRRQRAGGSSS